MTRVVVDADTDEAYIDGLVAKLIRSGRRTAKYKRTVRAGGASIVVFLAVVTEAP